MRYTPELAHRLPKPASHARSSVLLKHSAFVALMILLTGGTLILFGHRYVRTMVTEQIDHRLVLAAADRQIILQTYIRHQQERVSLVASRTRLRQLVEEHEMGRMPGDAFRSESRRILVDAQRSSEGFLAISITDRAGRVITSTAEGELGKNYSADADFLAGRREKSLGLPRLIGGNYRTLLTAPVATDDHRFLGVAIVLLDIGPMVNVLTSTMGLGESGEVLVGTRAGDRVRFLLPTRHQTTAEVAPEQAPAMASAIRGQTGVARIRDYRGVEVLAAYGPVGYRDWGLVAKIDVIEAYAPLARLNAFILAVEGGILLAGLIASYALAKRFTQPILELADKAATVASGDLRVRVQVRSSDELGVLAAAFNGMAEGLQQRDAERKQAEETLRKSEERSRLLVELSPDGIVLTDLKARIVSCNRQAAVLLGFDNPEQMVGLGADDVLAPEELERAGHNIQHLAGGQTRRSTNEYAVVKRDGTRFWGEFNSSVVTDPTGTPTGFISVFRDITERKQGEERRQRQAALIELGKTVAAAANDASEVEQAYQATVDAVCAHARWPVGHVYMRAGESDELIPTAIWHLDDPRRFKVFVDVTAATRLRRGIGLPGRIAASGRPAWVPDVTKDPNFPRATAAQEIGVRAGFGFPVLVNDSVEGVLEFFSPEVIAPDELLLNVMAEIGAQLGRVIERKRAGEVKMAKVAAEEANRAKSDFLSRMSHELRTPLNAILGFGQLLEMDALGHEQRESVEQILKGGRHLLDLINEVLDIARIEAGRLSLSIEPVPLKDLVAESLHLIRPLAAQRSIKIEHSLIEDGQHVMADRQRLKQTLLNLLSNAVKYNRDGGSVTFTYEDRPGDVLRLSVTDTGPGISTSDRVRIFSPFERLQATQAVEGTGLGLALSKGLVEAMGGTIGVDSTEGQGSTFWVELPQAVPAADEFAEMEVEQMLNSDGAPRRIRTILYVEDNISNLKLIERVMTRRPDIRLITAMQGRLGLDLAREHRPDLILLDLHVPDLRGDELLRLLREDPRTVDIPVIMLTATAMPKEMERLLAAGARAYLTKPIDIKALFGKVDEILED